MHRIICKLKTEKHRYRKSIGIANVFHELTYETLTMKVDIFMHMNAEVGLRSEKQAQNFEYSREIPDRSLIATVNSNFKRSVLKNDLSIMQDIDSAFTICAKPFKILRSPLSPFMLQELHSIL